jgi:hypothetical protein
MQKIKILAALLLISLCCNSLLWMGCAQIGTPTGGQRDTIAPVLIKAIPEDGQLNFTGNKVVLSFNEYIELEDVSQNVLVSPFQQSNPSVNSNLKTLSFRFKDSLKPNTTYSIHFGNAIKDVNEGNILKNFTYTFSTGSFIDSLELSGKVILAETGIADSTLFVLLYRNAADTAIQNSKPDYITRLDGLGNFHFYHLPSGTYKVYALKDGDGSKTYNAATELFAFQDTSIELPGNITQPLLYAYAEKEVEKQSSGEKKTPEKKLRYKININSNRQDLLKPLELSFNNPLKKITSDSILLCDTNFMPLKDAKLTVDSTRQKLSFAYNWQPEFFHVLLLPAGAVQDSLGNGNLKSDTIRFSTRAIEEYGRILLRFTNLDTGKHPVIQFLQNNELAFSAAINGTTYNNNRFNPGEYELRILYDEDESGKWTPGNYKNRKQPEKVLSLPQKLNIRADWDNERDIQL